MQNNFLYYTYFKKNLIEKKFKRNKKNILIFITNKEINKTQVTKALNFIFHNQIKNINSLIVKKKKKYKKYYIEFNKNYSLLSNNILRG